MSLIPMGRLRRIMRSFRFDRRASPGGGCCGVGNGAGTNATRSRGVEHWGRGGNREGRRDDMIAVCDLVCGSDTVEWVYCTRCVCVYERERESFPDLSVLPFFLFFVSLLLLCLVSLVVI